jgi:hypothetical protein
LREEVERERAREKKGFEEGKLERARGRQSFKIWS